MMVHNVSQQQVEPAGSGKTGDAERYGHAGFDRPVWLVTSFMTVLSGDEKEPRVRQHRA